MQAAEFTPVTAFAAEALPGTQRLDVITRLDDVPPGTLLSAQGGVFELSDTRREDVAIMGVSATFAVGLFSTETFGSALMFDIISQARSRGLVLKPRSIKREVIRLVYEGAFIALESGPADSTSIEKLIGSIVDEAAFRGASDIHIETRDNRADVLFRIDGERVFVSNMSFDTAMGLGQVLYGVHADVSSKDVGWSIHQVAEGSIDWVTSKGERLQLRFSSSPIYPSGNFQIVVRLMSARAQPRNLSALGYSGAQLKALDAFTSGSGGMVLMCGPTNSGKSTSLQSLIERVFVVRGRQTKVITVEDPVELVIPGACQISVGRRRTRDSDEATPFTSFLRGALRQDPDVVMIGEVRDQDTASLACDLALAGRKVFVTLHTYSALWAFARLREMGVRSELLTMPGFIVGLCYQKLVPVLCKHCSVPDTVNPEASLLHAAVASRADRGAGESSVRKRGLGCRHCEGTGIAGRTLVSEMVVPDIKLLHMVAHGDMAGAQAYWLAGGANPSVADGIRTSHDHVLQKILAGEVAVQDALNSVGTTDDYRLGVESTAC